QFGLRLLHILSGVVSVLAADRDQAKPALGDLEPARLVVAAGARGLPLGFLSVPPIHVVYGHGKKSPNFDQDAPIQRSFPVNTGHCETEAKSPLRVKTAQSVTLSCHFRGSSG